MMTRKRAWICAACALGAWAVQWAVFAVLVSGVAR